MRRWLSPYTAVTADVTVAIGLCGLGLIEVFGWWDLGGIGTPKPAASHLIEAILVVLATVPLTWRRTHPVVAVACTAATLAGQVIAVTPVGVVGGGTVTLLVLNFSVAAHASWVGRITGLALTAGAQAVFAIAIAEERVPNELAFGLIVIVGSWLIGIALHQRLQRVDTEIAQVQRRAAAMHASTLADERTRIARELHDVIAHGVSVMGVQSAAARLVLDREPDSAKQILLAVERQARESIGELQRLLSVLRSSENTSDRQPQPGLDNLPSLVQTMRSAGLHVDVVNHGTPQQLPPGADLAAYRIVQEALTNALKHAGPVTAHVDLRWSADQLSIDVTDHGARTDADLQPGHGLVGMRERAALYGGTVRVGARPAGGISVTAELPSLQPVDEPRGRAVTSVLLADDQDMVRGGFRLILSASVPPITIVGEARTGIEAVALARELRPDVVVMDIRMPEMDGIEATRRIALAGLPVRVLVLTTFDADEHVVDAFRAGASGFLLKNAPVEQLASAVHAVAAGDTLLSPALTRRLIEMHVSRHNPAAGATLNRLSQREREVLTEMAQGKSNQEIADQLVVSVGTVKTHVTRLLTKLGLRDRVQAVVFAYESGLVSPGNSPG